MTTQRQVESNRLNARNHATGPRTLEGKEASRRNALKHGLAGMGIVLPEDENRTVADRAAAWSELFKPDNPFKVWLVKLAALESVRVERCFAEDSVLRSNLAFGAGFQWDLDRRISAETVACGIKRKPALVSRKLRQSAQGCDLLLERWRGLVGVLDVNDDWNEDQAAMAMDLLGIPAEVRHDLTLLALAPESAAPGSDPIEGLRKVALAEIAALEALRSGVLDDRDGAGQGYAELGLGLDNDPALKQLRRYEADCKRRLSWALAQLMTPPEPIATVEEPAPVVSVPAPPPEPGNPPEPAPSPVPKPEVVAASYVPRPMVPVVSLASALTAAPESGNRRARRARRRLAMKS